MQGCLDDETVLALIEGRLSGAAGVTAHLDACGTCRALVVDVVGGLDGVPALEPGTRVGRYVIQSHLGAGAMGIVYEARDPDLDRPVALKVIRNRAAAIASQDARDRLMREAQAMARLSHPNVIAIYDVVTHGDEIFLAMELVAGGTLADWLRTTRSWREIVDVFRRAGEGLSAAHDAGIVHRDFKPDNVLVGGDGRVRVTDFGLARSVPRDDEPRDNAALPEARALPLTWTGAVLGTPAYMAPEQLAGTSADARSDIFSFCVAFYEALYGARPFVATDLDGLATAIAGESIAKPTGVRVPAWLRRVVVRGLHATPERRPATMRSLLDALDRGRHRARRTGAILAAALVVAAGVGAFAVRSGAARDPVTSIAVLPFADASPTHDQAWLSEAITADIVDGLSEVPTLRVAPRAESFALGSEQRADAAAVLGVGAVLEGSIWRTADGLHVRARMSDVRGGLLWSGEFDRDIVDGSTARDLITRSIVAALHLPLPEPGHATERGAGTRNLEAYELYLRGRQDMHDWGESTNELAVQCFRRAIQLDPAYAEPHAGIVDAEASELRWLLDGTTEAATLRDEALRESEEALQLAPELAEAHIARANVLSIVHREPEADEEFRRGLALSPASRDGWFGYGFFLLGQRRYREAVDAFERAVERDPDDVNSLLHVAMAQRKLGDPTKARDATERARAASDRTLRYRPDDVRALYLSGLASIQLGDRPGGVQRLERAIALKPHDFAVLYNAACGFAQAGEPTRALDLLERYVATGRGYRSWILDDPDLDSLHGLPRFQELVDRMPAH